MRFTPAVNAVQALPVNVSTGDSASLVSLTPTTAGPWPPSMQFPFEKLKLDVRQLATSAHSPHAALKLDFRQGSGVPAPERMRSRVKGGVMAGIIPETRPYQGCAAPQWSANPGRCR